MAKSRVTLFAIAGTIGIGVIAYLLFILLQGNLWIERYSLNQEEPYDLNLFKTLADSAATGESEVLYNSVAELGESTTAKTMIFMGFNLYADSLEAQNLIDFVRQGNTLFMSCRQISYNFLRALDSADQIGDTKYYYDTSIKAGLNDQPSAKRYEFEFRDGYGKAMRYWTYFDSDQKPGTNVKTLGTFSGDSASGLSNFRKVNIGKGQLIVHTDPLLFTNLYLLKNSGFEYANGVIQHLPNQPIIWDQYHQNYREEKNVTIGKTPMRFVMQHPPLKYAWYTLLIATLLFVVFRSKRQQRIIPLTPRVENTSIAFAQSLGALYYQANSGRYLAIELMKLFDNFNRRRFGIKRTKENEGLATEISKKTKVPTDLIETILTLERKIVYNPSSKIKDNVQLYQKLNEYYKLVRK